ncbi:MAG: cytochrome c [Chromatiales bacterium]|jgi:mono/diheme cytochrome c family protein|nr:cytochrome c [Chromatiales bacterium]
MRFFLALLVLGTVSGPASTETPSPQAPVEFADTFLSDPANFALGKNIWKKRCQFCHGKRSYPGKAPKLKPKRYTPQFVYERVTNGFRAMPGWQHEFNQHERMAVTAFIMHKRFSP